MPYTETSPLIGTPQGTVDQCVRCLLRYPIGEYKDHDVSGVIVPALWKTALSVGVDPVLLVGQLFVETWELDPIGKQEHGPLCSFWSSRDKLGDLRSGGRNPAGIGVDGTHTTAAPPTLIGWKYNTQRTRWEKGVTFPTWEFDAIPAWVGRILANVFKPSEGTTLQRAMVDRGLNYRSLKPRFQGNAQVLRQLGRAHNPLGSEGCGWASPGDTYGQHIADWANTICGA